MWLKTLPWGSLLE